MSRIAADDLWAVRHWVGHDQAMPGPEGFGVQAAQGGQGRCERQSVAVRQGVTPIGKAEEVQG